MLIQFLFWLSVAGLAYIYAGYPLAVWLLSKRRRAKPSAAPWERTISVVLVAHNEEPRITRKLQSIFASTSRSQIAEVLIGSDGSTDGTVKAAREFPDSRVRAFDFSERRGKPSVLNDLATQCRGDVIVFMDARQEIASTALRNLVDNFSDPKIGVVSGELVFLNAAQNSTVADGVGFYWTYEKWIRSSETAFRSVPGATGALYALRRELFRPIPADTLLDDVVIPMQAIEQGYRCILERDAAAYDHPSTSSDREAIRKRRTIAGCFQLMVRQPRWLLPSQNPIWWEFCSHKLARLVSPLLLVTAIAANMFLCTIPFYGLLLMLQIVFYMAAITGWLYQRAGLKSKFFGPPLMFLSLNTTTIFALWDAFRGRYKAAWQKS